MISRLFDRPGKVILWIRGTLGRYLSVRTKLTLWYGLMCAVTLGVIGLGMKSILEVRMNQSIDTGLVQTGNSIVAQLARNPGDYSTVRTCAGAFQIYISQINATFRDYTSNLYAPGQFEQALVVNTNTAAGPASSPLITSPIHPKGVTISGDLAQQAVAFGRSGYATETHAGEAVRTYFTPLHPLRPLLAQPSCVFLGGLQIWQEEHNYIAMQQALNNILLVGIPLGLLVALIAGWWIARAALRPINRISRTVQAIGDSRDLSRRLNFVGPHDEVGRLAQTFDGMMTRLENAFETQKQFIADASHELRTPLTAIRGNADLLKIAPADERELCIASIRREAERMSRLVNDLLLLAAADVEEQPIHRQAVDLDELLSEVYRSALVLAGDKLTVRLEPAEPVTVLADPDRIKQLLLNLLDNAVKFTPAGGVVTMSLYAEPGGARIDVRDTGIGIPPDEQDAIFRRFYRVEHARTKRGSGLGLAICEWVVSAHGGRLELESEPGKGTTFRVYLPERVSAESKPSREAVAREAVR